MKDYILSIIAAAIVCGIVNSLLRDKSGSGQILRILTGVLMAITVLKPLASISFSHITDYLDDLSTTADAYVEEGKSAAQESIAAIIKSRSEAYILDKANQMGLDIAVEVELDAGNNSIPCGVTISGALSPYAKNVLTDYIINGLGIPKENLQWM